MRVIADMLGFPPEDGPQFREFVENLLEGINLPPDERIERVGRLFDYLLAQVHDHLENPREDLTSYLIDAELFGHKLNPDHVVGTMALLLIAGIDTTWSAIGASLWHLAKNPGDRRRLVAEPGLLPTAMEEFLRAYAPVTMARLVKDDMHWHGVDMKADDWILLSFPAANRDPAQFDRAGEVVIDREVNRHAAFGLGIHRCVGSHLARMELRVALEVWLERIPVVQPRRPGGGHLVGRPDPRTARAPGPPPLTATGRTPAPPRVSECDSVPNLSGTAPRSLVTGRGGDRGQVAWRGPASGVQAAPSALMASPMTGNQITIKRYTAAPELALAS